MYYPSFKQLQFFIALAEHRHFGRASNACHISQAAFSLAIKALEERLDMKLVERGYKKILLTTEGEKVLEWARACKIEMDALIQYSQTRRMPYSGRVRLGVIPTIAPFFLPDVLPLLEKRFPDLEFYLREDKSEALVSNLQDGKLDMILLALPYPTTHFAVHTLFEDPFLLAASKNSRWLLNPENPIDPVRLPQKSVLLLDDGHCLREHALEACRFSDLSRINQYSATSLTTLLQMVESDIGVTFVPNMARLAVLRMFRNIELHDLVEQPARWIGVAWRESSHRTEEFTGLAEAIQDITQ